MKKRLVFLILAFALFWAMPNNAIAAETVQNNSVYVAGNPDLFPFEYYDTGSGSYRGILPDIYEQISQATGIEFVYIKPGAVNQQSRLAKNGQVEMVSAYVKGQIETAEDELVLVKLDEETEICVAFTSIAPEDTKKQIRAFLEDMSDRNLLELALNVQEPQPEQKVYWLSGIIAGILFLIIAALAVVLRRQIKEKKKSGEIRFTDTLTGIGNKTYFENTFRHYVTPANYALYYLGYFSLDTQKIEHYFGTAKAEEVQRYSADVLSNAAGDEDFAARIGEGVFLLAFQAPSEEDAAVRVNEILEQLNQYEGEFLKENRVLFRAGVFWMDTANIPLETAVFNARHGYNAAVGNKCPYVFTDKALLNNETTKIELQRKLSSALENREFLLYLQMIVDRDGKIIGAEALSRWQTKDKGLLYPAMFIEPMKSADIIDKLDFYVLEEVCKQLERWSLEGKENLWISCNFTRLTISRNDFAERFRAVLNRYSFPTDHLIIELTEDSLMDNTAVAYSNILECKKMGCKIALDDLGSGYSSLQDLCDYPIDMIKIDWHILLKATTERGKALLHGLIKLGHDLGMKVLCEGVESETENDCVLGLGCDYIQGFYHSRVLPRDEAELFYMRNRDGIMR